MKKLLQTIGLAVVIVAMASCEKTEVEKKTQPDNLPKNVTIAPNGDYIVTLTNTRSWLTYTINQNCLYSKEHVWINTNDGHIQRIGVSDFIVKNFGTPIYIGFNLSTHDEFTTGTIICDYESVMVAMGIETPVNGAFMEENEDLNANPGLVERAPYGQGYLCRIVMFGYASQYNLMTPLQYASYLAN